MTIPKDQESPAAKAATEHEVAEHEAAAARLRLERATVEREIAKLGQPLGAEEDAAQETALARLRLERAIVERDLARLSQPWWRSWNVTALGAFLAAIAPATAGVTGYFEKQKQLALEEQKQKHELAMEQQKQDEDIRGNYLDRMRDPHQSRRTLRLLASTSPDVKIRDWANGELPHADEEGKLLEMERARLLKQADEDEKLLRKMLDEKQKDELIKHVQGTIASATAAAASIRLPDPVPTSQRNNISILGSKRH